jgi:16S rRNA (adenine1518-N6/adenine1519-N6)-dimethyltransferase
MQYSGPKKSLGQNFLKSPAVVRTMAEAAGVSKGDTVLEIGPGKGVLTKELLALGAKVIAIEKDTELLPVLTDTFANELQSEQFTLINQDITTLDLSILPQKYKIVANIPYYITGEIIRTFLESSHQPTSMTLLVQKEVAQRIVARDEKGSILSMSVKAYGEPTYIQKVPAMLFNPAPKVDSAILHIANISKDFFTQYKITEKDFFSVVKKGFSQKRKKLTNNLNISAETLLKITPNPNTRAENLTLKEWGLLTKVIVDMV